MATIGRHWLSVIFMCPSYVWRCSDSEFSRKTITIMELQALMSWNGAFQKSEFIKIRETKFFGIKIEIAT